MSVSELAGIRRQVVRTPRGRFRRTYGRSCTHFLLLHRLELCWLVLLEMRRRRDSLRVYWGCADEEPHLWWSLLRGWGTSLMVVHGKGLILVEWCSRCGRCGRSGWWWACRLRDTFDAVLAFPAAAAAPATAAPHDSQHNDSNCKTCAT